VDEGRIKGGRMKTKLKEWKDKEGIIRKRLAEFLDVTPRHVTGIINGSRFPSKKILLALKSLSGLSWDDLMSTWFSDEDILEATRKFNKNIPGPDPYPDTVEGRLEITRQCMKISRKRNFPYPRL
jgi:transcriptional regulator with XRE-family HTH domain